MSVIGRLDGQVDEIIIKPISGRLREEEASPPPDDGGAPRPSAPPDRAAQTPHPCESSAEPDELPVWLL